MTKYASIRDVTTETAHPRAKQLLGQSIVWQYGNEDSPLGTDVGADTFAAYLRFRAIRTAAGIQDFVREQLALREYPDGDWDLLDTVRLKQLLISESGFKLVRRDDFIIGLAFAQLVLEGALDADVRQRALTALRRQATDVVLSFRGGGGEEQRKKQLTEFQRVLELA